MFGSEWDMKETQFKRHLQEGVRATKSFREGQV